MISNAYLARTFIESMVVAGSTTSDIWVECRNREDLRLSLGDNLSNSDFRTAVERIANTFQANLVEATRRGPLVRQHMLLQSRMAGLLGALMHAIAQLDCDDPRDIRDAAEMMGALERVENSGQAEMVFKKVLEYLEGAEYPVSDLTNEYIALFPIPIVTSE